MLCQVELARDMRSIVIILTIMIQFTAVNELACLLTYMYVLAIVVLDLGLVR